MGLLNFESQTGRNLVSNFQLTISEAMKVTTEPIRADRLFIVNANDALWAFVLPGLFQGMELLFYLLKQPFTSQSLRYRGFPWYNADPRDVFTG